MKTQYDFFLALWSGSEMFERNNRGSQSIGSYLVERVNKLDHVILEYLGYPISQGGFGTAPGAFWSVKKRLIVWVYNALQQSTGLWVLLLWGLEVKDYGDNCCIFEDLQQYISGFICRNFSLHKDAYSTGFK